MKNPNHLICLGLQFGDEGKGKIVDNLAKDYPIVVRFQGGNNAGHTLWVNGQKTILHQIPSGILQGSTCCIGNGCVLNLDVLFQEIETLKARGVKISPENLKISESAHLITSFHIESDSKQEADVSQKIGTTKRGIGPCYTSKASRSGVRLSDLLNPIKLFDILLKQTNDKTVALRVESELKKHTEWIRPFSVDLVSFLYENRKNKILFEGAQGSGLDVDHGTYPYVTSSNTVAGSACAGSGVGPGFFDGTLGVFKAYSTRVGEGPFDTELNSQDLDPQLKMTNQEIGEYICKQGQEYGSTTGRKRRCGWLDLKQIKRSTMLSSCNQFAITKLDVLRGLPYFKVKLEDGTWETFDGFTEDISQIKSFVFLPDTLKRFLHFLSYKLETADIIVSVGPDRTQQFEYYRD